jgi:methyltransferase
MILTVVLALVLAERLAELLYAQRNTRRLIAAGGVEHGRRHYPLFVALHGAWLVTMAVAIDPATRPSWPLLGAYAALQIWRLWVLASLGRFWTTRIIAVAGAPLVLGGPYRLMRHPNYFGVALELPLLPLAFGAWPLALGFGLANLGLLAWRIRVEERALAPRRVLSGHEAAI